MVCTTAFPSRKNREPGRRRVRQMVALMITAGVALTACGGSSGSAKAGDSSGGKKITLRFSALFQPGSAIQDALDHYTKAVTEATNGRVVFQTSYGGSLLKAADTVTGLQTRRADLAYLAPAYAPSVLPLWNLAMQPGIVENAEAEANTLHWLDGNNKFYQAELKKNKLKVLGYLTIGPLDTAATKKPITKVGDLNKLSLRAIGPMAQALTTIGVKPVPVEAQDAYESIQRGVITGTVGLPLDLIPGQGINEVAPWVTYLNYGTFGSGTLTMSLDVWDKLPADVQQTMTEVAKDFTAQSVGFLGPAEAKACDTLIKSHGGVTVLPKDEVAAWKTKVGDTLIQSWRKTAASSGASNEAIDSVLADFTAKNKEFAKTATYKNGLEACAAKTHVPGK